MLGGARTALALVSSPEQLGTSIAEMDQLVQRHDGGCPMAGGHLLPSAVGVPSPYPQQLLRVCWPGIVTSPHRSPNTLSLIPSGFREFHLRLSFPECFVILPFVIKLT